MDRFLVKTERSKTERKKRKRVVLRDDDDVFGPAANLLPRRTGEFMEQLAAFIAHENDLVKLSDDGNKATYGKPSGDDVYMCEAGGAFDLVLDHGERRAAGRVRRAEPGAARRDDWHEIGSITSPIPIE